jgi:hypothetical protein
MGLWSSICLLFLPSPSFCSSLRIKKDSTWTSRSERLHRPHHLVIEHFGSNVMRNPRSCNGPVTSPIKDGLMKPRRGVRPGGKRYLIQASGIGRMKNWGWARFVINKRRVGRKGLVREAKERPPLRISYLSRLVFAYPGKL